MSGHPSHSDDSYVPGSSNAESTEEPLDPAEQAAREVGSFLDNVFGGGEEGDGHAQRTAADEVAESRDRG